MKPRRFTGWQKGIKYRISTGEKLVAITLDACGGNRGCQCDRGIIDYLIRENVPAALFFTGRWIDANLDNIGDIVSNPLFTIENHGLYHKPCTVKGFCKYGLRGTKNVAEVVDEVELNARKIETLTGKRPVFFRSGGACYDDVALSIIYDLKHVPLNYTVNSMDYNHKIGARQLAGNILRRVRNGSIIILHMNHPERNTRKALETVIPLLKKRGYRFVNLRDYVHSLR